MRRRSVLAALVLLATFPASSRAAVAVWNAASGLTPDLVCPAWTTGGNVTAPAIVGGTLALSTSSCGENRYYVQSGADIVMPDTLVLEARLALDSGSECIGGCGHYRQAADLSVTTAPFVGTLCFVGPGEVLLVSQECAGAQSVLTNTSGMHDYTLRIAPGGTVTVHKDGVLLLTGHTYSSTSDHSPTPRVLWGEGSSYAHGASRWAYVRHNAHATGCPSTDAGRGAIASVTPFATPNPFRRSTTLRFTVASAGPARIAIFDVAGRHVRELQLDAAAAGSQAVEWDGSDAQGRRVRAGTYLVRITDAERSRTGVVVHLE